MAQLSVTLDDVMGTDIDPVKDAKVSFDNDDTTEPIAWEAVQITPWHCRDQPVLTERQKGLIRYLVRGMATQEYDKLIDSLIGCHDADVIRDALWRFRKTPTHAAPFGHCYLKFTVEAPVFVARQLVKHEYMRLSEVSRRYVKGLPEYFTPDNWSSIASEVKQGSGPPLRNELNHDAEMIADVAIMQSDRAYQQLLKFVSPEEARIVLPLCHMTRWRWSGSLDAVMNMCNLRLDDHAQKHTRMIAQMVGDHVKTCFPQSWASYVEGDI